MTPQVSSSNFALKLSQYSPHNNSMRLLCLHGRGTNSDIFESQLAPIANLLPERYVLDFLDGPCEVNAAPGVDSCSSGPYLAWHRRHFAKDLASAYTYVKTVIDEDGPYDGVIGFSQGAALAASLLLSHQQQAPSAPRLFKFAIFLSSVLPAAASEKMGVDSTEYVVSYEKSLPEFFGLSTLEIADMSSIERAYLFKQFPSANNPGGTLHYIDIPTLHILGSQDPFFNFGKIVVDLCDGKKREVLVHDGSHEVPRSEDYAQKIALLIENIAELSKINF
ncbi:EF-hcalcium-binding domain-containing protein [Fusarium phyllophilum]|uniref:EF-hcalcium-binding domain-containing protein n=1 Tax=Fusarium phyllophilum TaxID=47803 RepID=A0A8H5K180_9HYPO|nr:EF-hcalcium-binding domain-containing protein [Fusarium phyllophilum]